MAPDSATVESGAGAVAEGAGSDRRLCGARDALHVVIVKIFG